MLQVSDVMMQQGHQCHWRHGIATAEIPPPMPQVDSFKIVFDTGQRATTSDKK